jgi:hypothetical protein
MACRKMVVALKEMSIRGEFVTPVEYLIKLMEDPVYVHCQFNTGWLGVWYIVLAHHGYWWMCGLLRDVFARMPCRQADCGEDEEDG